MESWALESLCFYSGRPIRNAVDPICMMIFWLMRMNTECIRAATPMQRRGLTSKS